MMDTNLARLVAHQVGPERTEALISVIDLAPEVLKSKGDRAPRAVVAMAMNVLLMGGLLERVPTGASYVADQTHAGRKIFFDHGAVRTVLFDDRPTGALPAGELAFTRILGPLGYVGAGSYPLDRLRMMGRAYKQEDLPEVLPQFFVSELIVSRFSDDFQQAARRVFMAADEPLDEAARILLSELSDTASADFERAANGLPGLVRAFSRVHPMPSYADYEKLRAESAEAAWIATEGNAFNHVTDRVIDLEQLSAEQRRLGRPIKEVIEISRSGRVRQTAFKADLVERQFASADGRMTMRVPGSFYEFISRDRLPNGVLDLTFDSGNAQGIFKMTDLEPVL